MLPTPNIFRTRETNPNILHRTAEVDRAAINETERTVDIAFSSEAPVERWFGTEILAHEAAHVRLGRLNNGGAVLVEHDRRDQVGVVVSASIGADKKGRAKIRFGKSARAEEIFQDIKDGIRRLVSVGYRIHKQETTNESGGVETVRVTDWEPFELSLVSIPADDSVGVGRGESTPDTQNQNQFSTTMNREQIIARLRALGIAFANDASTDTLRSLLPEAERNAPPASNSDGGNTPPAPAPSNGSRSESNPPAPAPRAQVTNEPPPNPERAARTAIEGERRRTAAIQEIADQARANGIEINANRAIADGVTPDAFREQAFTALLQRQSSYSPGNGDQRLSRQEERDLASFSIVRGLRSIIGGGHLDGIEREMQQEAQREARESGINLEGNFHIPAVILNHTGRRDMTATGGSAGDQGGTTIATNLVSFIDLLYARLVVRGLGAQFLTDLQGNIDMPKLVTGSTVGNKAENGAGDESSPTTGKVSLSPKRATTFVEVSNQLLMQSSYSVEQMIRNDLATALALIIEQRAIAGSGSSNQPLGILGTGGIGSVAGGTNGAAPDFDDIVDLETLVAVANADIGNLGYLTNPKVRGKLKKTPIESGTSADKVWANGETPLNGYRAAVTTQVPSNLTKGSADAICSAIIFGNFQDLVIAQWGGVSIMANPYSKDTEGIVRLTVNAYHDNAVRRAQSFAAMQDALTA